MPIAKIQILRIVHGSNFYGSDDHNVISRVEFTLELNSRLHYGLYATIKQPVGIDIRTVGLEVSQPLNYHGPFNYRAFRAAVEAFYRDAVARINAKEAGEPELRNYIYERTLTFECEVDPA